MHPLQRAYEFFVNPLNVQGDVMRSGEQEDGSFEMVWNSATRMTDTTWTVELGIPFKSLRFPDTDAQQWTVLIGRKYPRETQAIFSASPISRMQ